MLPKIVIIILNWNGKYDTVECINSLKNINYENYEIKIIDNGSIDDSVEFIKNNYSGVEVIQNKENLGYAEGNNVGMRHTCKEPFDYILLLNNDTIVAPDFLNELVWAAEDDPKVGFAGPMIYYYDYNGRKDVISFMGGKISKWRGTTKHLGQKEVDKGQYNKIMEVDYAEGSCLLVKREVLEKIGLLDSRYFLYWEDSDWCDRGLKIGYKTISVPKAKIWHKISAASNKKGGTNAYYMARNNFVFMKKNANKLQYLSFIAYFMLFEFWYKILLYGIYHRNMDEIKAFIKGTSSFFTKNSRIK